MRNPYVLVLSSSVLPLLIMGCAGPGQSPSASSPPAIPAQTQPAAAVPSTTPSSQPAASLADARAALLAHQPERAFALASAHTDPSAMVIRALAAADLDNPQHMAEAQRAVKEWIADAPASPRAPLTLLYLLNPSLRTDRLRAQLLDENIEPYALAMTRVEISYGIHDDAQAFAALQQAERYRPDSAEVVDRVLATAMRMRNWQLAEEYLDKAAQLNVDRAGGHWWRGMIAFQRLDMQTTATELAEAVKRRPDDAITLTTLGASLFKLGRPDEARPFLERSVALQPSPDNVGLLGTIESATNPARALELLYKARQMGPYRADFEANLDGLEPPAEVIARRTERLKAYPDDVDNRVRLALVLQAQKRVKEAIDLCRPAYEKQPRNILLATVYARLLASTGRVEDVNAVLHPLVTSSDPAERFQALLAAGGVFEALNDPNRALEYYQQAVPLQPPGNTEAQRHCGDLYFNAQQFEKAAEMYASIVEGKERLPAVVLRLGECYIRTHQFDKADDFFQEILRTSPGNVEVALLRGLAQMEQGHPEKAFEIFAQAHKSHPRDNTVLYYWCYSALVSKQDLTSCMADLVAFTTDHPKEYRLRWLLGRYYVVNDQRPKAAETFTNLLNDLPPGSSVRELVQTDLRQLSIEEAK